MEQQLRHYYPLVCDSFVYTKSIGPSNKIRWPSTSKESYNEASMLADAILLFIAVILDNNFTLH